MCGDNEGDASDGRVSGLVFLHTGNQVISSSEREGMLREDRRREEG